MSSSSLMMLMDIARTAISQVTAVALRRSTPSKGVEHAFSALCPLSILLYDTAEAPKFDARGLSLSSQHLHEVTELICSKHHAASLISSQLLTSLDGSREES